MVGFPGTNRFDIAEYGNVNENADQNAGRVDVQSGLCAMIVSDAFTTKGGASGDYDRCR